MDRDEYKKELNRERALVQLARESLEKVLKETVTGRIHEPELSDSCALLDICEGEIVAKLSRL